MKILLTGSSGTIGTRVFEKLLEKGHKVVGFDRKPNIWHSNLDKLTIKGDLLDGLDGLPGDFDIIIHLAANARVYNLVLDPDLAFENVSSIYNILEFARKQNIKKFIFSSSREVYGNKNLPSFKEEDVDIHLSESSYGASKLFGEAMVYSYKRCYGIEYVVFRFSNVYGMYDLTDRFVPLLIGKMMRGEEVDIYGADKVLDFTYIDDCVNGIIKGIENFPKIKDNTYNIAYGKGESLFKTAELLKELLKSSSRINFKSNRPGEVIRYSADISKSKELLGYKPEYPLEKGMELAVEWYLENKEKIYG